MTKTQFSLFILWSLSMVMVWQLLNKQWWRDQYILKKHTAGLMEQMGAKKRGSCLRRLLSHSWLRPGKWLRVCYQEELIKTRLRVTNFQLTSPEFMALKKIILIAGMTYVVLFIVLKEHHFASLSITIAAVILAFFLPDLWLKSRAQRELRKLGQYIPDFIDMLSITLDAGINLEQALEQIVKQMKNPLTVKIRKELGHMKLGTPPVGNSRM